MIGENRKHIAAIAEHILGESLQRFFRTDFNEDARARVVECAQALHELHWRRDLLREDVQHLRNNVKPHGIKLAVRVGDNWQMRRFEMQALQNFPQRLAGSRHDRRVEGVADDQRRHVIAGLLEGFHGLRDRLASSADYRLTIAVDVGNHHIAIDRLQNSLDLFQWRKHRGHAAVVVHRDLGHPTTTRANGFQRIGKR